ncbi:MAG: hypothetical protein QOI21_4467 [Actinomycetota bacterium]|nr:hypothetical protein [Actinomycetota bacterium]
MSPTQPPSPHHPPSPPPPLDAAQEDELIQQIGARVLQGAPKGWRRIDVKVTMATMVDDIALTVIMSDGSSPPPEPPPDIKAELVALRQGMYQPGRGTWLSLRLILDPPGSYVVHYNFDYDPLWDPPVPPVVYQRDLEAFPRDTEHLPAWYPARMQEGTENA